MFLTYFFLNQIFSSNLENSKDWKGLLFKITDYGQFEKESFGGKAHILASINMTLVQLKIEELEFKSEDAGQNINPKYKNIKYKEFVGKTSKRLEEMLKLISDQNIINKMLKANREFIEEIYAIEDNDPIFLTLNKTLGNVIAYMSNSCNLNSAYNMCLEAIKRSKLEQGYKIALNARILKLNTLAKQNKPIGRGELEDIYRSIRT